jgi:hypothetical protein
MLNGDKNKSNVVTFYTAYADQRGQARLCYYHDVELFKLGERGFFALYPKLYNDMRANRSKYTDIRLRDKKEFDLGI